MARKSVRIGTLVRGAALAALAALVLLPAAPGVAQEADEVVESSMTVSSETATLELRTREGETHRIRFRDGRVSVDGEAVGGYEPGGALEQAWRGLLASGLSESPGFVLGADRLRAWEPDVSGDAAETHRALMDALDRILGAEPATDDAAGAETSSMQAPGGDQVSIAPGRLSVERLTAQLRRLQESLGRLGEEARASAEDLAFIVHDDHEIPRGQTVDGNLALLDGELRLGGQVNGDVLVLDGTLLLEPAARVEGDVLQVGGEVQREGGRVAGEFLSVEPVGPSAAPEAPSPPGDIGDRVQEEVERRLEEYRREHRDPGFFGSVGRNIARAFGGVVGVVGMFLLLGLAGVLGVYFLQPQLETVADTTRHSFGRSFGVGLAGQFLFFPVLLVLVVAVITWLVIPFYVAASAVALLAGYLAVAHAAGELLARRRFQYEWMERLRRSNSYYFVLSGLAVLLLPFALAEAFHLFGWWLDFLKGLIHFLAVVGTWVAVTAGLGAVLLSRGGQRTEYARPATSGTGAGGGAGSGTGSERRRP
jgi:hypothetical protein